MPAPRLHSHRIVQRFARDDRGTVLIIFAVSASLLFLAAGIAVDTGRLFLARSAVSAAIDAAVLAGARSLQLDPDSPAEALDVARRTYVSNLQGAPTLLRDDVAFAVSSDGKAIDATGTAMIGTTLLQVAGIAEMSVVAVSGAKLASASVTVGGSGGSNIEVAVMLDVTGSMCDDGVGPCTSGTKLTGLKEAAKRLVEIVVSDDQSHLTSKVAVMPFSTRVRVGPNNGGGARMSALTGLPPTWSGWMNYCSSSTGSGGSESAGNWTCTSAVTQYVSALPIMPCVTDRYYEATGQIDATDRAPGAGAWLNAHDGTRMTRGWDSSGAAATSYLGASAADPSYQWNYASYGCADVAEANEIVPLTSDRSTLMASIDGLEAYGATAGALGTAWAWYMLSPEWQSIFSGASAPAPYSMLTSKRPNGAPELRKVAVLMTDGGYNTFRSAKEVSQQTVSNYALQLCSGMKAKGIEVFTVGLALDQLPAAERAIAEQTLRACGTDISHFYNTLNVQQLYAAFTDIAMKLSAIRLTQ